MTENGGIIISGRSDTILNPGGVRIGTAEIYREVEKIPAVLESIAVGQAWGGDSDEEEGRRRANAEARRQLEQKLNDQVRDALALASTLPRMHP